VTRSFLELFDLLGLGAHDGSSGCPMDQTPVFSTLFGHTGPHGSYPDGGWSLHPIVERPQGNPQSQQSPGWGAASRNPPGHEVFRALLGFRPD
jgi:hypothetical protein